jgi:cytidylate kinase
MGAGGEEIGQTVADSLGFRYVDEEIVAKAAAAAAMDVETVAREEERKTLLQRMLTAMAQPGWEAALAGAPPVLAGEVSSDEIRAAIRAAVEQTAAEGNVVIVAHAASHALGPGKGTLRVLVTASPATRAARLEVADDGTDRARAERVVKDSDAARRDYLKRFYDVDESPTDYDLVLNTDVLGSDRVAELIVRAASG